MKKVVMLSAVTLLSFAGIAVSQAEEKTVASSTTTTTTTSTASASATTASAPATTPAKDTPKVKEDPSS